MIKGKLIENIRWALHETRLYCISDLNREDASYYFESGIRIYNASPN
jgi:hypothetical protein